MKTNQKQKQDINQELGNPRSRSKIKIRGKEREREHTGLLGLAIHPLGNGKMNLLTFENLGLVRLLETVPDQIGTNV